MIEIFDVRIEPTNTGEPLADTPCFVDFIASIPERDTVASLMRRVGTCEERRSGTVKDVFQVQLYQLPAATL